MIKETSVNINISGVIMKQLLLIALVIVFIIAGAACDNVQYSSEVAQTDQYGDNLPYEYTKPQLNVDNKKTFYIKTGYDPKKIEGVETRVDIPEGIEPLDEPYLTYFDYQKVIEVFCEPSLTFNAIDADIDYDKGRFVIKPKRPEIMDIFNGEKVLFSKSGEWGLSDEYFIVQKFDPKSGKPLQKPLVTRFTVKKTISKPVVSFSVDNQGVGHFSWEPVENATKYYIVKIEKGDTWLKIIGSTAKTEWSTVEQDEFYLKYLERGDEIVTQNREFKNFHYSDDDLISYGMFKQKQEIKDNMFGIVAANDTDTSAFYAINGSSLENRLPYSVAYHAVGEMKANVGDIRTFDDIPTHLPVIMADSSTALRPIVIDISNIKIGEKSLFDKDDNGKISFNKKVSTCIVPYTIKDTMFKGEYRLDSFDIKNYQSEAHRIAERNKLEEYKTGESTVYTYSTKTKDLSNIEISRTEPDVPYRINATNPLTKYLAANMIAGNQYIDVSNQLDESNGISIYDAADEARVQNPYILGLKGLNYIEDLKILEVEYKVTSSEERTKLHKAVSEEVDRVIASIISGSMTDEAKVKAINDYIINTAEYDYDALNSKDTFLVDKELFKNAWNVAGIFLDKKAVCAGYAYAFKALADEAGLEAVYVGGLVGGEGHAWNKVKINGKWKLIDVTWNDSKSKPNEYYLITDEEAGKKRNQVQEKDFVIDILVDNYATK